MINKLIFSSLFISAIASPTFADWGGPEDSCSSHPTYGYLEKICTIYATDSKVCIQSEWKLVEKCQSEQPKDCRPIYWYGY